MQNTFKDIKYDVSVGQIEADSHKLYKILYPELIQLEINNDDKTYTKIARLNHSDLYEHAAQVPITIMSSFITS